MRRIYLDGPSGAILYSGDFRLSSEALEHFHTRLPSSVQSLYLDTTFFHPSWSHIPTREFAVQCAVRVIRQWLQSLGLAGRTDGSRTGRCLVYICLRTHFVYEHLLETLAADFNTKIYVRPKMAELYSGLSEHALATHLCSDPDATWIHVCSERKHTHGARRVGSIRERNNSSYHKRFGKLRSGGLPSIPATHLNEIVGENRTETIQCVPTLTIIPTAMWFGLSHHILQSRGFAFVPSRNPCEKVVRLLYCTHASYSEMIEFVRQLRPRTAVACAVPRGDTEETVQARLDQLVREVQMVEHNVPPSTVGSLVDGCAGNSTTGSPFMESFLRFAEHRRQTLFFPRAELSADDPSQLDFVFS
ncbi:DNA cross-link repair 1C protein [Clonorchis sinensis]|uniref:DNA cross-link repair 1C protein n=1 Tax=Clonorchis sinensis TaxID=79923 RepID=H2KUH0_CLOSI|nr:DNA cross-link repair 1C protein [Clonorchis sinensis]